MNLEILVDKLNVLDKNKFFDKVFVAGVDRVLTPCCTRLFKNVHICDPNLKTLQELKNASSNVICQHAPVSNEIKIAYQIHTLKQNVTRTFDKDSVTIDSLNFDLDGIVINVANFQNPIILGSIETITRCTPFIIVRKNHIQDFNYLNVLHNMFSYKTTLNTSQYDVLEHWSKI